MRAQAQFTIYTLNDVVTSATAPTPAYLGQLWVDTSKSPPVTMVWNGSAWKEQNGTDTIRTSIKTIETKEATLETNLNGLISTVSSITKTVETIESDTAEAQENILALQTDVSELEQTSSGIALRVTKNETNISSLTVSHNSVATRVSTAEGNITSLKADVNGLKTRVSTAEGDISTLEQTASSLSATVSNKADKIGGNNSSFGWQLNSSGFYLYSNGVNVMSVTSSGLVVNGEINALSGTLTDMTVNGRLTMGNNADYYIDANYDDGSYYIYMPGLRIDESSGAVFSGNLSAPSGSIGGFTIGSKALYNAKSAYNNTTEGVYLGTDGIGLGAGTFYVTSAGALYCTNADIKGKITATSGTISEMTVTGKLYFGNNNAYYISPNYNDLNYYIKLPGLQVDDASGARFTKGVIGSATYSWTIGGSTTYAAIYCGISSLPSSGGMGTVSNRVYIGTDGIAVKCNKEAESTFDYTTILRSGMAIFYGDVNGSSNYNRAIVISTNRISFCASNKVKVENANTILSYSIATLEMNNGSSYVYMGGTYKAASSISVLSDRERKNSIEEVDDRYSLLFDRIKPKRFKYNDGTSGRYHTGFIAQEVKNAMDIAGIDTKEFAALCYDTDENGELSGWSLRYDEFIALHTMEIQKLKAEIKSLKEQIGGSR